MLVASAVAVAQSEPPAILDHEPLRARVNQRVVYQADVDAELRRVLGPRTAEAELQQQLRAEVLARLIDRQLVLEWLESRRSAATEQDVDLALQRLEEQLKARGRTLDEFLAEQQLSRRRLRARFQWTLSWRRLLDRYLTDENLSRYFEQHRRDFDGTRLHVAHILWKVTGPEQHQEKLAEAKNVREAIQAGKLSFADAARKHSAAPTAAAGGDLGWIARTEPMPEVFSRAAFALAEGETSAPVITDSGIHLIHCLAIEPGQRTWQEVRAELESAVAKFVFQWAADQQRDAAQIEIIEPAANDDTASE